MRKEKQIQHLPFYCHCIRRANTATIPLSLSLGTQVQKLTDTPLYGFSDNSFQAAGATDGIRKLVDDFYLEMDALPEATIIRKMHKIDLTESRDKLTLFLCGWMGGPRIYHEKYGNINIPRSHAHLPIGEAERDAWLLCMEHAIAKQNYTPEFSHYLLDQLRIPAERIFATSRKTPM
jgi:hemoglobin